MLEYQKSSAAPSPFTCECLFRHFALLVPLGMKLGAPLKRQTTHHTLRRKRCFMP